MTTKCQQELNVDFLAMRQTAGHFKRGVHRNIVRLLLIIFICNRRNVEHTHCCISAISQPLQGSLPHFSSQLNSTHNSHCHYKALYTPPAANKSVLSLLPQLSTWHICYWAPMLEAWYPQPSTDICSRRRHSAATLWLLLLLSINRTDRRTVLDCYRDPAQHTMRQLQ